MQLLLLSACMHACSSHRLKRGDGLMQAVGSISPQNAVYFCTNNRHTHTHSHSCRVKSSSERSPSWAAHGSLCTEVWQTKHQEYFDLMSVWGFKMSSGDSGGVDHFRPMQRDWIQPEFGARFSFLVEWVGEAHCHPLGDNAVCRDEAIRANTL